MKIAAATWVRASASGPPTLNTSRNTSAFLRKLSLNAEKNWHQNKGAKRRVAKSDEAMIFPKARGVGTQRLYKRQFGQNDNRQERPRQAVRNPDCPGNRSKSDRPQLGPATTRRYATAAR